MCSPHTCSNCWQLQDPPLPCQIVGTEEWVERRNRNRDELQRGRLAAKQTRMSDPMTRGVEKAQSADTGSLWEEEEE